MRKSTNAKSNLIGLIWVGLGGISTSAIVGMSISTTMSFNHQKPDSNEVQHVIPVISEIKVSPEINPVFNNTNSNSNDSNSRSNIGEINNSLSGGNNNSVNVQSRYYDSREVVENPSNTLPVSTAYPLTSSSSDLAPFHSDDPQLIANASAPVETAPDDNRNLSTEGTRTENFGDLNHSAIVRDSKDVQIRINSPTTSPTIDCRNSPGSACAPNSQSVNDFSGSNIDNRS